MNYLQKKKKAMLNYVSGGRLPSEYQEVEWIGTDGKQSINLITESSSADYEYIIETEPTTFSGPNNYNAVFTHFIGGNGSGFRINPSTHKIRIGYKTGSWTDVGSALSLNTKYKVAFDKYGVSVNDTFISAIPTGSTTARITMFAFATGTYGYGGKTYYAQVKENGTLIRDLIPCYRKADDVIGMYDLVNNVFYTNIGQGTFTKGNDV